MYKNVLLAVDLNDPASWAKALPTAANLCETGGGNLHVITVVPHFGMSIVGSFFPEGHEKAMAEKAMESLRSFCAENVPAGIPVQHIVGSGRVYESVL